MREIPKKNYFILAIIIILTIILVIYLGNWYKATEEMFANNNLLAEKLPEVKLIEIDTFLQENPNVIVYIDSNVNHQDKLFEKRLYDYVIKNNLTNSFVYLNKNYVSDEQIIDLQKKYGTEEIKNTNMMFIPNFYVFKDGKIINFCNKNGKISYQDAIKFLKEAGY